MELQYSNKQDYFSNNDDTEMQVKFNINLDDIDNMLDLSKKTRNDFLINNNIVDSEIIIEDEIVEDNINSSNIIKLMNNYAIKNNKKNTLIAGGDDDAPDKKDDGLKKINNKTTLTPYKSLIKAKSIKDFNQTNELQYQKLIRLIRKKKEQRLKKQLEIRKMKMKVIAIKLIYFLGTKALKIYLSTTCAPLLYNFLFDPVNMFNLKKLDGFLTFLESIGIIPIHLIHELKDNINLVKYEFSIFMKTNYNDNTNYIAFLDNPSKENFESIQTFWKEYSSSISGVSLINTAIEDDADTGIDNLKQKLQTGFNFVNKFIYPQEDLETSSKTKSKDADIPQIISNFDILIKDSDTTFKKSRHSLIGLCKAIHSIKSINANFVGIILNTGQDFFDITAEISNLSNKDVPTRERPDNFIKKKIKGNLLNIFSSSQLSTYLDNYLPQAPMYLFSASPGRDSDDMALLGSIKGIVNTFYTPPKTGNLVTNALIMYTNAVFKIEEFDVEENTKINKKKEFEDRVKMRAELYEKKKYTKKQIDKMISDKFNIQSNEYKSNLFNELNKIFVKKDIKTMQKFFGFTFAAVFATELMTCISGSILSGNLNDINISYGTFSSMLFTINENERIGDTLSAIAILFKKKLSGEDISFFSFGTELAKLKTSSAMTSSTQKILGVPKQYIINWISSLLNLMIKEIQAIMSDTIKLVTTYFNDYSNKDKYFNVLFGNKTTKVIINYTLRIFEFLFNIYTSSISGNADRLIYSKIMKIDLKSILMNLSFEKFVDIFSYINQNSYSIWKFINTSKLDYSEDEMISSINIVASLAVERDTQGVIGSIVSLNDQNTNPSALEGEDCWFCLLYILKNIAFIISGGKVSKEEFLNKRREFVNNYGKNKNNHRIVANDPFSGRSLLVPISDETHSSDTELKDNILVFFLKKFLEEKIENTNGETRNLLRADLRTITDIKIDLFRNQIPIQLQKLNVFKYFKGSFAKYAQTDNYFINPMLTQYMKNLFLGSSENELLTTSDEIKIYPKDVDEKHLVSLLRMNDIFKYKYQGYFDKYQKIIIPDSYFLEDIEEDKSRDVSLQSKDPLQRGNCDFNNLDGEHLKKFKDIGNFIKDMLHRKTINHKLKQADKLQIVISIGKCTNEEIQDMMSKLKKDLEKDVSQDAVETWSVFFDRTVKAEPYKNEHDTNNDKTINFYETKIPSFDTIELSKWIYDKKEVKVVEEKLDGKGEFFRPKTVKIFDYSSGRYLSKTFYIPSTFDDYYTPNASQMRDFMISKLDLLKMDLDSIDSEDSIYCSIKKRIENIYSDLLSDGLTYQISDLDGLRKEIREITSYIEDFSSVLQTKRMDLKDYSKRIKSKNFVGAFGDILGFINPSAIISPNLETNESSKDTVSLFDFINDTDAKDAFKKLVLFFQDNKVPPQPKNRKILVALAKDLQTGFDNKYLNNKVPLHPYELIPLLFNPKAINNNKNEELITILDTITKFLAKQSNSNIDTSKLYYKSLKSGNNEFASEHHILIRDGISKFIYTTSIQNMIKLSDKPNLEQEQDVYSKTIWEEDEDLFILKLLKKAGCDFTYAKNQEKNPEAKSKYDACSKYYSKNFKFKGISLEDFISINSDKIGNLEYDSNKIYLYNGADSLLRRLNIGTIENSGVTLKQVQKHYITLLEHSRRDYDTKKWNTEFYTVILKAMGLSSYNFGYLSTSNKFKCSMYSIFLRDNDKEAKLKNYCDGQYTENSDLPEAPPKVYNEEKFTKWFSNEKSTKWLEVIREFIKDNKIDINDEKGRKLIDEIESLKSECSKIKCNYETLSIKYNELYDYLLDRLKIDIPSMKDIDEQSFIRYLSDYRFDQEKLESYIKEKSEQFLQKLNDFQVYAIRRKTESSEAQVRTDNSGSKSSSSGVNQGNEETLSEQTAQSQHISSGPATLNQDTQGTQELSSGEIEGNTPDQDVAQEEKNMISEEEAINIEQIEDIVESISEELSNIEDTVEGLSESLSEKLLSGLAEAFSGLSDLYSQSRTLGSNGRIEAPNFGDNLDGPGPTQSSIQPSTDETVLLECKAHYSPHFSASSNFEENGFSHMVMHQTSSIRNIKEMQEYIKQNCLVESQFLKTLSKAKGANRRIFKGIIKYIGQITHAIFEKINQSLEKIVQILILNAGWTWGTTAGVGVAIDFIKRAIYSINTHIINILTYEVAQSVNSTAIAYQTKFLFNAIFHKQEKFSDLELGTEFEYNNQKFIKKEEGKIILINEDSNTNQVMIGHQNKDGVYTFTDKNYKTFNIKIDTMVNIPSIAEYSIEYILGEENLDDRNLADGTNLQPLTPEELTKKRLLLANLYTIIGSPEYEEYAKLYGKGLKDNWRYFSLNDPGSKRASLLEKFNKKLLRKLWGVNDLVTLRTRRNTLDMQNKPERPTKFSEVLKFKNYQSWGDISTQAFTLDGALDITSMGENLQEVAELFEGDLADLPDIDFSDPISILSVLKDHRFSSKWSTKKMVQMINLFATPPAGANLMRFSLGDNSMQEFILKKVLDDQNNGKITKDQLRPINDEVKNIVVNSDQYDYYRDTYGVALLTGIATSIPSTILKGVEASLSKIIYALNQAEASLRYFMDEDNWKIKYIQSAKVLIKGFYKGVEISNQALIKFIEQIKNSDGENSILNKFMCEEIFNKVRNRTTLTGFPEEWMNSAIQTFSLTQCNRWYKTEPLSENIEPAPPLFYNIPIGSQRGADSHFSRQDHQESIFEKFIHECFIENSKLTDTQFKDKLELFNNFLICCVENVYQDPDEFNTNLYENYKDIYLLTGNENNLEKFKKKIGIGIDSCSNNSLCKKNPLLFFKMITQSIKFVDHPEIFKCLSNENFELPDNTNRSTCGTNKIFKTFLANNELTADTLVEQINKYKELGGNRKSIYDICNPNQLAGYSKSCDYVVQTSEELKYFLMSIKMILAKNELFSSLINKMKKKELIFFHGHKIDKTIDELQDADKVRKDGNTPRERFNKGDKIWIQGKEYEIINGPYYEDKTYGWLGYEPQKFTLIDAEFSAVVKIPNDYTINDKDKIYFESISSKSSKVSSYKAIVGELNREIISSITEEIVKFMKEGDKPLNIDMFFKCLLDQANTYGYNFEIFRNKIEELCNISESSKIDDDVLFKILSISKYYNKYAKQINENYKVSSWLFSLTSKLWYKTNQNPVSFYRDGLILDKSMSNCGANSNLSQQEFDNECRLTIYEHQLIVESIYGHFVGDSKIDIDDPDSDDILSKYISLQKQEFTKDQLVGLSDEDIKQVFDNPNDEDIDQCRKKLIEIIKENGLFIDDKQLKQLQQGEDLDNDRQRQLGFYDKSYRIINPNFMRIKIDENQIEDWNKYAVNQGPNSDGYKPITHSLPNYIQNLKMKTGVEPEKSKYLPIIFVRCPSVTADLEKDIWKPEYWTKDMRNDISKNEPSDDCDDCDGFFKKIPYVTNKPDCEEGAIEDKKCIYADFDDDEWKQKLNNILQSYKETVKVKGPTYAIKIFRNLKTRAGLDDIGLRNYINQASRAVGFGDALPDFDEFIDWLNEIEEIDLYDKDGKLQGMKPDPPTALLTSIEKLWRSKELSLEPYIKKIYTKMQIGYKKEINIENYETFGLQNNELLYIDRSLIISNDGHNSSIFHTIPSLFNDYTKMMPGESFEEDLKFRQPLYKLSSEMNLKGPERLFICKHAIENMNENEIKTLFSQHLPKTKENDQISNDFRVTIGDDQEN